MIENKTVLARKKLFNETGDIDVHLRKMIGGSALAELQLHARYHLFAR